MPPKEELYRTNDMGMVAWLRCNGFRSVDNYRDSDRTCWWAFSPVPTLLSCADLYLSGNATVEPKRYNHFYATAKQDLHKMIDRG